MSRFFIERPIFSSVISIIITLAGLVAFQVLPVAQYPEIAPPTVTITAALPGASAETLSRTVAAPIEEQISGVEGLLYFQSTSSSNGTLTITCTFEVGTDVNNATIQVNNRVQIALPRLPDDVKRTGVVVQKRSLDILLFVAVTSTDPRFDTLYLSNFMTINALDVLKRVPGVADATIFGARDYSMRIWLRPDKMAQLGVTATDVANAIRAQSNQYAAGKIGQDPAPDDQALIYTVTAQGRLVQPGGVRQHRTARQRSGRRAAREGHRAPRAGRDQLRRLHHGGRPADYRHRGLPAIRRQRTQRCELGAQDHGRDRQGLSGGRQLHHSLRHHALRAGFDQGGDPHAVHRGAARARGGVRVPAELARHAHSVHRRADLAHRVVSPACTRSASRSTR